MSCTLPREENVNIHEVLEHVRNLASTDLTHRIEFIRDYESQYSRISRRPR